MKKILYSSFAILLGLFLVACQPKSDTIVGPVFDNIENGYLESLDLSKDQDVDLLEGVSAKDYQGNPATVTIIDNDNFNISEYGSHTIKYEATDLLGNKSTALRYVNILMRNSIVYDALFINEEKSSYVFNNEDALNYTSSGTQFRSYDQIQVMTKEFFIDLFNNKKGQHANNGEIPFFSSGVIVILDQNMKVKHLRVSPSPIEVDALGNVKTSNLNWTNSIDKDNGGGNFMNIIETLNNVTPDGGLIIFAPPKDQQLSKKFLVKNLFNSNYESGTISSTDFNIDFKSLNISLVEDYEEFITEDEYENEPKNTVITHDKYLDGIPVTTYYFNDGIKKPVIFFFHGFGSSRKVGIADRGIELAKLGFYVVSLDAFLHGERQPSYFANLSYGDKQKEIVNIQIQTALDAKKLYDKYYSKDKYVKQGEVYSFGVSMGAGSAIYLASILDNLNSVVSMLGSPSFYDFYEHKQKEYNWATNNNYFINLNSYIEHDPFINHSLYKDKNIYFANGTLDNVVPAIFAKKFKDLYPNNKNIIYELYETAHTSTPKMHQDIYDFLTNILRSNQ